MVINKFKNKRIEFEVNGFKHVFKLYHNFPDDPEMNIQYFFEKWLKNTTKYSVKNFKNYVHSLKTGFIVTIRNIKR